MCHISSPFPRQYNFIFVRCRPSIHHMQLYALDLGRDAVAIWQIDGGRSIAGDVIDVHWLSRGKFFACDVIS